MNRIVESVRYDTNKTALNLCLTNSYRSDTEQVVRYTPPPVIFPQFQALLNPKRYKNTKRTITGVVSNRYK